MLDGDMDIKREMRKNRSFLRGFVEIMAKVDNKHSDDDGDDKEERNAG